MPGATRRLLPGVLLLPLLLTLGTLPAGADPYAEARREFVAAYRVAAAGGPAAAPDSAALRAYPLYPYLEASRLLTRVEDPAAAADIEAFLRTHGDAPVARDLRRSWLMALAGRKAWEPYLAAYRADVDDTSAARCNALAARVALGRHEGLVEDVTAAWLSPRSLPAACDPAFAWLRDRGGLSPELVERRARLALAAGEAGLGRYLAGSLPEERATPLRQWAALIERPRAEVEALVAEPGRPVEPEALLDGWRRLARSDPAAAAALYPSLVTARGLDARAASPYVLAVGLGLSWSRLPRALEFFALADPADYDERAHEWQLRAALWAGDWPRVRRSLEAMPEALRSQHRWRYWAARAADALGEEATARAGYEAVLPTDNWYAALSAARLGRPFAPTPRPLPRDAAEITRLAAVPDLVRARELLLCELPAEADREWRRALQSLSPAEQLQAVHLASGWGWHLPAIAAAARLGQFDDYELLYPRPYDAEVKRAAAATGLPPSLIYAVIRQESLYRPDAASSAGALGLMQLLPSTAQATARRAALPVPTSSDLLQPAVNVSLGATFLHDLIRRADGQLPVAVAGYNAGPAAARRWLPASPLDVDVWVENIPFNETRSYVQRVHWHALVFAWLEERKPRKVGWALEPIRPATATGVPPGGSPQ